MSDMLVKRSPWPWKKYGRAHARSRQCNGWPHNMLRAVEPKVAALIPNQTERRSLMTPSRYGQSSQKITTNSCQFEGTKSIGQNRQS